MQPNNITGKLVSNGAGVPATLGMTPGHLSGQFKSPRWRFRSPTGPAGTAPARSRSSPGAAPRRSTSDRTRGEWGRKERAQKRVQKCIHRSPRWLRACLMAGGRAEHRKKFRSVFTNFESVYAHNVTFPRPQPILPCWWVAEAGATPRAAPRSRAPAPSGSRSPSRARTATSSTSPRDVEDRYKRV